jgi:hypothetical protein
MIPGGIAAASYLPADSADFRNSWLIFRYKLQPSQNCRIIRVASLRPPTMHIRLSDRHAGKAAEAPVVPDRGFSAGAPRAPCDNLRIKIFSIKTSQSRSIEMCWRMIYGFRLRLEAAVEPEGATGFNRRARSETGIIAAAATRGHEFGRYGTTDNLS